MLKVKGCCSAYVAAVTLDKAPPRVDGVSANPAKLESGLPAAGITQHGAFLVVGDLPPPSDLVIQHRALRI